MNNETQNDRIQFDWSKYETSDYEVICRDGSKPKLSGFNPDAPVNNVIIGWDERGIVRSWFENGNYSNNGESRHDLFLIPKQKQPEPTTEPTPESDLIDFDYEKFKTGDYDLVETKAYKKFKFLDFNPNRIFGWEICGEIDGRICALGIAETKMRKKKKKYQVWVNLFPGGYTGGPYTNKKLADNKAGNYRIECRLIEWEA